MNTAKQLGALRGFKLLVIDTENKCARPRRTPGASLLGRFCRAWGCFERVWVFWMCSGYPRMPHHFVLTLLQFNTSGITLYPPSSTRFSARAPTEVYYWYLFGYQTDFSR